MPDGADPYRILDVSPTASDAAITSAYRRLLRQYHPDTASTRTSADQHRLRQILAAYRQLRRDRRKHSAGISTAIPIPVHHHIDPGERGEHPAGSRSRPNEVWVGECGESTRRPGRRRIPVRYRDPNDDKPPAG